MTFEETKKLWFPLGFGDYDGNLSEHHLKAAWNAAIEAAQEVLSKGEYYWPASSDYGPYRPDEAEPLAEFAIEILKTK